MLTIVLSWICILIKLVDQPEKYDSFERLFIQKNKLLETLDFCKEHRIKQLEVIHGIGDGTLQKLVYDTLESQYGVTFYNKDILHHQSGAVIVEISDIFLNIFAQIMSQLHLLFYQRRIAIQNPQKKPYFGGGNVLSTIMKILYIAISRIYSIKI